MKKTITLHPDDAPFVLDWMKAIVAIDSAAIAALTFTSQSMHYTASHKVSIVLFALSMVLVLSGFVAVAEHKRSETPALRVKLAVVVVGGFLSFVTALLVLVALAVAA